VAYNGLDVEASVLVGYGDADWGSDEVDHQSTSGYVFFYEGGPVSWKTQKQTTVAISTMEAEDLSATEATKPSAKGVAYNGLDVEASVLVGYGDADWGSDEVDRRSTSGYVFFYGGGPVSWKTRKQTTVAISTVEAEYLSATEATKQALHH